MDIQMVVGNIPPVGNTRRLVVVRKPEVHLSIMSIILSLYIFSYWVDLD